MKNILVTGINGFVGQHLAKELSDSGYEVVGIGGTNSPNNSSVHVKDYMELDLTSTDAVKKIDFSKIDGVVHLAGLAAVGPSFNEPKRYIDVNVGIEINLFEEALRQWAKPKFLIISSGTVYDPKAKLPLTEESPVLPSSPYAVSKLAQEQMAEYYGTRGFDCIIARPFNHIGPGQGLGFIVPDLAEQVVKASSSGSEILVGNLDAKRDYTDVRDIAKAYRLLLEKGSPGQIFNVCSESTHDGNEILNGLMEAAGKQLSLKQDPSKMRPSDTPIILGSRQKLTNETGWEPEISLSTTLRDVINSL